MALKVRGFYQLLDGITSVTIICNLDLVRDIISEIPRPLIINKTTNIAALIIISPAAIERTYGVVSHMLEWLAHKEINVEEVVSCYKDTIILVATEDGGKAFDALNELILICRRIISKE